MSLDINKIRSNLINLLEDEKFVDKFINDIMKLDRSRTEELAKFSVEIINMVNAKCTKPEEKAYVVELFRNSFWEVCKDLEKVEK